MKIRSMVLLFTLAAWTLGAGPSMGAGVTFRRGDVNADGGAGSALSCRSFPSCDWESLAASYGILRTVAGFFK
jgi:hypothetical protein